ncbi:MAG: fumarylacetoacetate hydrolase family protein [Ilumatobacter sp.]
MGFRLASVAGRAVLVVGDGYFDVATCSAGRLTYDPMQLLAHTGELNALDLSNVEPSGRLADVLLDAPVPRPTQVFGVGLNYRKHAEEGGMDIPEVPVVFTKFASAITGPMSNIELRSDHCDYEGELVVVIGAGGRDIPAADAWSRVAGLCAGQDVSDRAVQMAATPPQFSLGKSFDTFGPIGPVVVSPDEFADPTALRITTSVNGEVRQDDSTADLIFDVATLVSYLSHITTLHPGDLIFTGTPGGVGAPTGSFLRDGDVVTTTIDGIGTMTNPCVRISDHPNAHVVPAGWRAAWKASTDDD